LRRGEACLAPTELRAPLTAALLMALSKQEVLKVGTLSRIRLSEAEVEKFATQLSAILGYVDKLRELDTDNVEPLAHALALHNVLRADEPTPGLTTEQALGGAPESAGDFFKVPRVLDEGAGA
jgi:aspartyl-tRNA(Asn)/glutamyl-tRNA(Gln) amidotransferase subunit C